MATCPECDTESEFVYLGLIHIRCINPFCRHYDTESRKDYDAVCMEGNTSLEFDLEEETKDEAIDEAFNWFFPQGVIKD